MFFKLNTSIVPRFGHESLIKENLVVILGGGNNNGFIKYLELYNLTSNEIKQIKLTENSNDDSDSFGGLASFKMTYLIDLNFIIIFGGIDNTQKFSNELMVIQNMKSLKTMQVIGEIPSARIGHTFTKLNEEKIALFGGVTNSLINPTFLNDLYILHVNNLMMGRWEKIDIEQQNVIPSPRESHSAILRNDHQILIFGGMNGSERLNDTWLLDISDYKFTKANCSGVVPIGRSLHTAVKIKNSMYIFGGRVNTDGYKSLSTSSIQFLNLNDVSWHNMLNLKQTPEARCSHSSFVHHGRMYILSGRKETLSIANSAESYADCWFLETQIPPPITSVNLLFTGNDAILIEFSKTINAVCYLIEIREPVIVHHQANNYDEIKVNEKTQTIAVRRNEQFEVVRAVKKPKIIIHEHKVLNLLNHPKSIIPQLDGIYDHGSETESEMETTENDGYGRWKFVKLSYDLDPVLIKNYYDCSVGINVTTETLPKITTCKQFSIMPKQSYQIRVRAINSIGSSKVTKILMTQTASTKTLSCLRLEQCANNFNFSWRSTAMGMNFVVVLIVIYKDHFKSMTVYKGKKNSCIISKENFDNESANEYVLHVSIITEDGKNKICEHELRWKTSIMREN